jgi:ankyrin repeat protein
MKTKFIIWFAFLAVATASAQTNSLTAALQQGLFEEEANRNLDAAISNYQSLAAKFDQDRQVAATAIFRLGECYRKLGRTNDAVAQYRRVINEFGDQTALANLSQQNLAGLGATAQGRFQERLRAVVTKASPDETAATGTEPAAKAAELEAEAASLKAQVGRLSNLKPEDFRIVVQQSFPNPVLTKLMQDLTEAEQKLAGLTNDYGPGTSQIVRAKAQVDAINGQIDAQVAGVIKGLQAKIDADLNAAKTLRESDLIPAASAQSFQSATGQGEEIRRMQVMIQNSPDLINAPSGENRLTPLCAAASKGQLRVADFLLDHGADVNLADGQGKTALYHAAEAGNKAMVELLLGRGADVNARDGRGQTALHLAAANGFQSVAEALLANHADVNARDQDQETPLHLAARNGHAAMVTFLIAHQADLNAQDRIGWTPLSQAARAGHSETVRRLLAAGAKPDPEDSEGRTPLSHAVERGHLDSVKALLAAKANPNAGRWVLPLHLAIHRKDSTMIKLLLDAGADANRVSPVNWNVYIGSTRYGSDTGWSDVSPLFLAIAERNADAVKLLLQHQADPNGTNPGGLPVILSAMDQPEIVKALLEAGANPNVRSSEGQTPLFMTMDPETVVRLLAHKADPEVRYKGSTPLLLFADGPPDDKVNAIAEALIQGGANVNATTEQGWTALHLAVARGNRKLVELLLAHKADVNARNNQGETPLDLVNERASSSMGSAGTRPLPIRSIPAPRTTQSSPQTQTAEPASLADLLRQHGALADLPDFSRIRITRQGVSQPWEVFRQSPNLTNHFTLLETVMRFYNEKMVYSENLRSRAVPYNVLTFPDFGRVIIHRPSRKPGSKEQEIKVSLLNHSNMVDCAEDVPVEFGDVIEIPERVHALNERLPDPVREMKSDLDSARLQERLKAITDRSASPTNSALLAPEEAAILRLAQRWATTNAALAGMRQRKAETKAAAEVAARRWACLQKTVQLVVAGETTTLDVDSWEDGFLKEALATTEARAALRSSSDLSRVKVTRQTGNAGKPLVLTVDASDKQSDDLWLQDGDVIEVPEKP